MKGNGGITCGSVTVHGPLYAITCDEDVLLVDQGDLGALVLVVGPALWLSGQISEMERQQEIQLQPNDNKDLSLGHGNEADNDAQ